MYEWSMKNGNVCTTCKHYSFGKTFSRWIKFLYHLFIWLIEIQIDFGKQFSSLKNQIEKIRFYDEQKRFDRGSLCRLFNLLIQMPKPCLVIFRFAKNNFYVLLPGGEKPSWQSPKISSDFNNVHNPQLLQN